MKVGDEIDWIYGFKVIALISDAGLDRFSEDRPEGKMKILDGGIRMLTSSFIATLLLISLNF